MQPTQKSRSCRVLYREGEIVIQGEPAAVQDEAARILKRFACSATPYRLVTNTGAEAVLRHA